MRGYEFDQFRVEPGTRLLLHQDRPVPLTPKAFDTLLYLVQHSDRVVGKEELMTALWPDTVVEENNLNQNISTLRRILQRQQTAAASRYIVTVPGRGYRFAAEVRASTSPEVTARSIAVLPFKPIGTEHRDEALELGMADTLIARLSGINPRLIVRPLSSVRRYCHLEQDTLAAARELHVQSILEGSIQRQGKVIRITARMLDAADGSSLWAQTFQEDFTDVFMVQDRIAEKVVSALALQFAPDDEKRWKRRYTQNVEAYHLYLKGRYHVGRTVLPSILKSIEFFQQAIDLDPLYALAYAGLADAYRRLPISSDVPPNDAFPKAKAAALKALEIDEDLAEAHTWLGFIKMWFEWDWTGAELEMERAIALDPLSGDARMAYEHLLTDTGRHTEALLQGERAVQTDPLSLIINANHGWALFFAGRYAEALDQIEKTLQIEPKFWVAQLNRGKLHLQNGEYQAAIACFTKARELSGGNTETTSLIGYTSALAGDHSTARALLGDLKARAPEAYTPPFNIAVIHNGLNERDEALSWLEKALQERDVRLVFLKKDVKWQPFRQEPRFTAILKRVGLG